MADLYSKASFILTANAYSSSKLFSIKPTDGTGDLTFTRASSGSRINSSGVLELVGNNVPRLTYSGSSCPQFLFEPQRTNFLLNSENPASLNITQWYRASTSGSGVFIELISGPYGATISSSNITFDGGSNNGDLQGNNFTTVSESVYTYSIWVKGINGQTLKVGLNAPTSPYENSYTTVTFNGNWQRVTGSYTAVGTITEFHIRNNFPFPTTNATVFNVWAPQVELGRYPTSYIPTTGATVTRIADNSGAISGGPNISSSIGQSEGTIYYEFTPAQSLVGQGSKILTALAPNSNAAASGSVSIILDGNDRFQFLIYSASSATIINTTITSFPSPVTASQSYKIACAYSSSNSKLYINGNQVLSSAATWPLNGITGSQGPMNRIWLSDYSYFSNNNGNLCKTVAIYKTRLTDSELIALTS